MSDGPEMTEGSMIRGMMFGGVPVQLPAIAVPVQGIVAPMKHTGGLR